jgi:hypothetical protein
VLLVELVTAYKRPEAELLTSYVTVSPVYIEDDAGDMAGVAVVGQLTVTLELQSVFSAAPLACDVTVNTPPAYKVFR